jgi:hypothetical protein
MASTTHPDISNLEHIGFEQTVPEQAETLAIPETVSEPDYMITSDASDA